MNLPYSYYTLSYALFSLFVCNLQATVENSLIEQEAQESTWIHKHTFYEYDPSIDNSYRNSSFGKSKAIFNQYIAIGDPAASLPFEGFGEFANNSTGSVSLFDVVSGQKIHEFRSPSKEENSFGGHIDLSSKYLLVGAASNNAYLFDLQSKQQIHNFTINDPTLTGYLCSHVALSENHALVAVSAKNSLESQSSPLSAYLFDLKTGAQIRQFVAEGSGSYNCSDSILSLSEKYVAIKASETGDIYLFDIATGSQLHKFTSLQKEDYGDFQQSFALFEDEILIGNSDSAILFDLTTYEELHEFHKTDPSVYNFGQYVGLSKDYVIISEPTVEGVYFYDKETGNLISHIQDDEENFFFYSGPYAIFEDSIVLQRLSMIQTGEGREGPGQVSLFQLNLEDSSSSSHLALSNTYINESVEVGATVGQLTVPNLEDQEEILYSLSSGEGSEGNTHFSIIGSMLVLANPLDFENQESYSVRIQARLTTSESWEQVFQINIIDDRSEDADKDGINEELEEDFYYSSDLSDDSDADGYSDFAEIISGTNPSNKSSQPVANGRQMYVSFDGEGMECFGQNVSLNDEYALIGNTLYNVETRELVHKFIPKEASSSESLDCKSALSINHALIKGSSINENGETLSVAYLFDLTTMEEVHKLVPSDNESSINNISSIALTEEYALIASNNISDQQVSSTEVYLFDVTTGEEVHRFSSPEPNVQSNFGASIALSTTHVLIGSTGGFSEEAYHSGYAYLFNLETKELVYKFAAPENYLNEKFGGQLALSESHALISGVLDDRQSTTLHLVESYAYLFDLDSKEVTILQGFEQQQESRYISSLSLSNTHALIAYKSTDMDIFSSGIACLYDLETKQRINSFIPVERDEFSYTHAVNGFNISAALSENRVLIGSGGTHQFTHTMYHGAYVYALDYQASGFENVAKASGLANGTAILSIDSEGRGVTTAVAYALGLPLSGDLTSEHRKRLPRVVRQPSSDKLVFGLNLPDSIPEDVTLCVVKSNDLGADAEWTEVARKEGNTDWSGSAEVTLDVTEEGTSEILIEPLETEETRGFMKLDVLLTP